jgi:hypothetical protein
LQTHGVTGHIGSYGEILRMPPDTLYEIRGVHIYTSTTGLRSIVQRVMK